MSGLDRQKQRLRQVAVDAERHWWVTKLKALPTVSQASPRHSFEPIPRFVLISDIENLIKERTE